MCFSYRVKFHRLFECEVYSCLLPSPISSKYSTKYITTYNTRYSTTYNKIYSTTYSTTYNTRYSTRYSTRCSSRYSSSRVLHAFCSKEGQCPLSFAKGGIFKPRGHTIFFQVSHVFRLYIYIKVFRSLNTVYSIKYLVTGHI